MNLNSIRQVRAMMMISPGRAAAILTVSCGLVACGSTESTGPDPDPTDPRYDEDGVWSRLTSLPEVTTNGAVAFWQGHIYVTGGYTQPDLAQAKATTQRYNVAADRWERLADLPEPIARHAMVVYRDTLLLIGGLSQGDPSRDEVWWYDSSDDTWHPWLTMRDPRSGHRAIVVGDRIVVFGGGSFSAIPGDSTAVFENGAWRRGSPMRRAFFNPAAAAGDGRIYVIGGLGEPNIEVYDPDTDSWSFYAASPVAGTALSAAAVSDRIHIVSTQGLGPTSWHWAFDPSSGDWSVLPPVTGGTSSGMAVGVADDVFVLGGLDSGGRVSDRVWRYRRP